MPGLASTVAVNGAAAKVAGAASTGGTRGLPPGPGEFVSRDGKWYPAQTAKTYQAPDPENPERRIDVPFLDNNGKPILEANPAAVDTIMKETAGEKEFLPVIKAPEAKNDVKDAVMALVESQKAALEMQRETNATLALLVQATLAKNKGGRPPKVKEA